MEQQGAERGLRRSDQESANAMIATFPDPVFSDKYVPVAAINTFCKPGTCRS